MARRNRSTKSIFRLIAFSLIVVAAITVGTSIVEIIKLSAERESLEMEKALLERQKRSLELELESISTEEYIEGIARKDLKLIKSNELLFVIPESNDDGNK